MYCGEQQDETTGLYYLRARYMNPETGTFTSMDTYGGSVFDSTSLHKYLYANANPVSYTDPSGYFGFADVVISNGIMANLAFYSISGGLISAGLNLLRQLKTAQRIGQKINWGDVFWAGFEGALLGSFFGLCGLLAASMSSVMIFIALGCSSFIFAAFALYQADVDLKNGDYDLFVLDLIFSLLGFKGAEKCFDAAVTCSSASETAGTSTNTSPRNTNTASTPDDDYITLYRGTSRQMEIMQIEETNMIMSDSMRNSYYENGCDVDAAYHQASSTHQKWIEIWGNESDYAYAHGEWGGELPREFGMDRTFVSATTDPKVAEYFATYENPNGQVYTIRVPRSSVIFQPNPSSGESEVLIRIGCQVSK